MAAATEGGWAVREELARYMECAEYLINHCRNLSHISGAQKLEKKCLAELKHLKSLSRRRQGFETSHLRSSNLSHYLGLIQTAEQLPGVTHILQAFQCPGRPDPLHVDVVAGEGHIWVKVVARKAQALHLVWAGEGQYGEKDTSLQAEDYITCAGVHPVNYMKPNVVFAFYNSVTTSLAGALEKVGVLVVGHREPISDKVLQMLSQSALSSESGDNGDASADEEEEGEEWNDLECDADSEGENGKAGSRDAEMELELDKRVKQTVDYGTELELVERKQQTFKTVDEVWSEQVRVCRLDDYKLKKGLSDVGNDDIRNRRSAHVPCVDVLCASLTEKVKLDNVSSNMAKDNVDCEVATNVSEEAKLLDRSKPLKQDNLRSETYTLESAELYPVDTSANGHCMACKQQVTTCQCAFNDFKKKHQEPHSQSTDLCPANNSTSLLYQPQPNESNLPPVIHEMLTTPSVDFTQVFQILSDLRPYTIESIPRVNLDVTALITLVSSVTNGGCFFRFKEKILSEQAAEEMVDPVLPKLNAFLEGKTMYTCETAVRSFEDILKTLGGENEISRAKVLLKRITVVKDNPSFRTTSLPSTAKIKERSKTIFGTGDSLKAVTVTANSGFVRAALEQGVMYTVFLHASRALTETKESTAEVFTPQCL